MKRFLALFLVAVFMIGLLGLAGCGGDVKMSPAYSQLLDQTAALSSETATRAKAGKLSTPEMVDSLDKQSQAWKAFQDARDGRSPAPTPGTPPGGQ